MAEMKVGDFGVTHNYPKPYKSGLIGQVVEVGMYDISPHTELQPGYQVDLVWTPYEVKIEAIHPILKTVFVHKTRFKPLSDPDKETEQQDSRELVG